MKVFNKCLVARRQELCVIRLKFPRLKWPKYSNTALPVNHFVHTNKPMSVSTKIASAVLKRWKLYRGRYSPRKVGSVGGAMKRGFATENLIMFVCNDEPKLFLSLDNVAVAE